MRAIGLVTVGRSDYGIYLPVIRAIQSHSDLKLVVYVSGAHLVPEYGMTVNTIESDGVPIAERVEMLLARDTAVAAAEAMGRGTAAFAASFARTRPDILLVLGDRFEMHSAAVAAVPLNIPLAHIGGGEITEGAIDDVLRHSITKLSHLHFVSTAEYARRVQQLGEEPWRIVVSGTPAIDNLKSMRLLSREELETQFRLKLNQPFLLVTYHSVTREGNYLGRQLTEVLAALDATGQILVFTMPNADPGNLAIRNAIEQFVTQRSRAIAIENLGTQAYFSLMNLAAAMVGNSSSGIIEAPSFRLPVVNIGTRQQGRMRARNVMDVGNDRREILGAIKRATAAEFRKSLEGLTNPFGDGRASEIIVERLASVMLDERLLKKKFHDLGASAVVASQAVSQKN